MEFPVDILASVAPESLEQSAKDYMSKLLYRNSEIQEYLSIPGSKKIEIGLCNVSFVPLYGVDIKQKLLALFSPEDPFKAVGLYLLDRWWSAEDILKTADSSRTGLIKVRTTGERIVLYVLNRIIYRTKEMAGNDAPFLCHGEDEIAKILWKNGEAIGFYSVKPEGRLCKRFLTHHYQLPVMDTIFIRKCHRGNGHGLQMLEDFVDRFKKDLMGLKYPLSPAMYKVCKKYLSRYPEDTELLWEIEGVGSPFQRTQIARKLQAMDLKALGKSNLETEDIPMEAGFRQVQETMEHIEVVEEVVRIKITKEVQDTPVTTRGRSSNLKRKKLGADKEETPGKILRVEDIEPDVQSADDPVHEYGKLSVIVKEPELKDTVETMTHDVTPISETTHLHCEDQNKLTPEPTYQSEPEKDQVDEITPVMEIQSLKDNAQIMKTFEATIVPVDLQPLELHQVVEVEIVKMSSETEEVKEKGVEVKEMKDDVNKVIPLDERETSEEIVESQKDQTEMADTTNIEDIVDEVEMRKISVENIVGDTEVEKEEPGVLEVSLVEKEQSEQVKVMHTVEETGTVQECLCDKEQETEDQELSPDNEWEKVSSLIQQEEYSNMAYSSGLKGKCGDKRRSNYETPLRHSVRLRDQAAEGELAERVLRSSSKQTLKTTSKQVYTRQARSIKQPEKIKQVEDEPKEKGFNQTESQAECTEKAQQRTDDQNPREVENKMEDSSQDENKMDEKLRNEEQDKMTAAAEEVGKAAEDGEEMGITDVNNAEAYTDGENVVVVEDKIKKKNIEETEVRHDKIEIEENILSKDEDGVSEPTVTDENKIEEAQEEELMKEPNAIQSEEPEINDIELSLDYEDGKDGEKMAVVDVHDAEDVNTAQIEVEVKVPEPSVAEPFEEQEEESTLEMMPAEIVQNTEEATSTLKLQKVAVVLVDLDTVSTTHTYASENASGKSQPERTDDRGNKEEEGLNQQVEPTEKEQEVEMAENENETVEGEISSIEETEEIMERVITTDVDRVSELTTDENKMEDFQQEKVLKETKTVQDAPDEEIKSKDIIESSEDDEEVKSDVQIELSEEEEDKTDFVTPLRRSKRLKHQVAERELAKRVLRSSTKTAKATCKPNAVKQRVKTKQPVDDPEVEQMKEAVESHTGTAAEKKIESVSITTEGCRENLISALNDNVEEERNIDEEHLEEKITDYQNLMEVENKMEDSSQHENKMNTAEIELEGETLEQSTVEPVEEQDEEPASEMVPKDDVPNTEETTSALKLPKAAVVLVDFNKVSIIYTDVSEDAKGTSQSQEKVDLERHRLESTDRESQAEHTEEEQVVEMRENEIENSSIEETEEKVVRKCVVSNDEDRVPESAVTDEENMEEDQKGTTAQEIPGEEPKSLHVIKLTEDDEGVTSDVSLKLAEEEVYKEIITTEGCGENLISALKVIFEEGRNEDEERLGQNVTDAEHLMEVENKTEDSSQDENKVDTKLRNNEQERVTTGEEAGESTKDDEKIAAEGKSTETSAAESVEEQEGEPASEIEPAEDDDDIKEATSTLKLQNVAVVLVDFNEVSPKHESDDSEMDKVTSQPQEEVIQELYKPDSTYHSNEGKEGENQTECEVELGEKEQEVEMIEEEHEETKEVRDERMEIEENIMSKVENKLPESTFTDEKMMNETQEAEPVKQTNTNQDIPGEEENIQNDIESSEDEGLKSDAQIELSEEEEDKTSFVTPLRRSRRLRRQAVESELTKRVLRSSTKAAKATSKTKAVMQQAKTKQPVDDPEEQVKEVLESDTETAVKEKIESVSITTETEEVKALEGKKPGQSAAEPTEEQEEEPASETGPSEDDYTEEATSPLKLQKVAVGLVDFDTVSTTHTDAGKDAKGTSQSQEEVDLELHKLESPSTESQAEHSEKEQVVEMTENEIETGSIEETDEKMESEEGDVLNDEDRVPLSTVPDEENIEEVQNETDTAQEIAGEEPKSRHVIEPSEDDGERSDVLDEEDEASSVTPLRRSRRLEDQAAESKLTKRSLRSSAKLTNKATPQQRHERQIKAMMLQEEPEKLDESKNNEMNVILGSEVAVGDHMESDGDPENMISAVQSTCEEGSSLEKTDIEADDHKNIKNIRTSDGNEVENNIRSEGVTEQDKMAPEDIIHGETEQVCTAVHIELSEVLEEAENNVQEEGAATEMAYGEDSENIMETTTTLTLQEASVVLMDIKEVLPNLTGDCSSAFETAQEEMVNNLEIGEQAVDMPEEVKEGIQTEVVEGENIEIESVNLTEGDSTDLNAAAKGTAEEDSSVLMSHLENETTDTNKLEEENIVMKHGDESKVEEESKTEQFTLQGPILTQDSVLKECSETTTHVHGILDLHNAEVVKNNISIEEQEEELAIEELALEEDRANVVGSMSMLKLQKAAVMLVDFQRHTGGNEADGNETTQSQEVALLTKANEENALVEMDAIEPVTEGIEEEAVCMDNTLITNDEQDRDILAEEGVKDELKEVEHTTLKEKSTATELDSTKTLKEGQESTAPAHGDGVQEHTQDEDISVYTNRNLRRRTYTKVNKNREEEISDEEVETVFTRSLRRRTVTVTPRRRSKRLTGTRVAELEMDSLVTKVCPEILAVQSTEESRAAVEEAHETNSKCDSVEVPAVSEAVRKDREQNKNIPGNDPEKVEEGTDGDNDMVEAAVDHKEILVEGDLPDEYQEKEEPELNQEQVRSASSGQERDQQDNAPEETLLEKTFEEEPSKRVEEKHLVVQSDEGVGVERRALRKRTITTKATSVRKSKRLCKQDQGENDGQTVVWTNTGDSATVMADVKSLAENETTDQGKGQEIEDTNTKGGEISHKDEDQENAEGEEIDGNATNSQESTTGTEDMSKQAQLSEFLNVSEEDTDSKLVAQEEKNGEENKEEQSATEEITESENNAGAADKVTDEPKEFEDTQGEPEQIEKNAEEMTEASVTVDGNFTLELDEEIDRKDAECHRVVEETKASFQESEKEIADAGQESGVMTKRFLRGRKSATASPEQRSSRRSRRLLQDSLSETEDKSEAEEVRKVIGEEVKKPQQKRKAVVELTARRSKRLTGAEIV
ncbi:titin homolog isoform X2 [Ictalurus furcatus]|uniref:titin homolog isoform X2 n=1 Tax=Ictalurus furcatus TaxID=66913 RepID=UPI00234FCF31|nr:titin homolog isoform X2 [Ictalurus furcatus]